MKKMMIAIPMLFFMFTFFAEAAPIDEKPNDSKQLMFQDMLMLFLLPHIDKKIDEIYSGLLKYSPEVYPYFVDVKNVKRVNGFRGFHFVITLEVNPTVGPHISVGKDLLTFDVSPVNPNNVKLIDWKHLKDPVESDFPPNWQDVLITNSHPHPSSAK